MQGCATQEDSHSVSALTVEEAKSEAQFTEDGIASMIPSESVTKVEQHPNGGLLSCKGESAYQWYGHTYVHLRVGVDAEAVIDGLIDQWAADESFAISTYKNLSDRRVVELDGHYNSSYFVDVEDAGAQISIASFSPCFTLPKGVYPGGEF